MLYYAPGDILNFRPSRRGLKRERGLLERERGGGLFTKSIDKDIFGSFSVLLSNFAEPTYIFTTQTHEFNTVFIPNHVKIRVGEGLVERRTYFKFRLRGEGLIIEGA